MDGERDAETVDGDDSELSISISVGDVSVEVSGRADKVEFWYDVVKNDVLEPLDEETIRAAAESSGQNAASTSRHTRTETSEDQISEDASEPDNESGSASATDEPTRERTLPEYYKMADDLMKKNRALLVGWFLTQQGNDEFTRSEIEEKAKNARIELGSNVSRDLRYQISDGHVTKIGTSEGSTVYQLTLTGQEYVEEELLGISE
jgi:hypothetical protein